MYDQCRLLNGLTIIGERLAHFRSVSIGLWLEAGSQYESAEQGGLSHFLEHMLFKGTERRSARQIAEAMDEVGGQLNAFTAKECTCFYARVIDEHAELALDVLSDLALNAAFDPSDMEKEKGVILEEISMMEDEPEDLAHELIMLAHYGDQPLARPILGTAGNVRGFTRERVIEYRDHAYRPGRAVLAVAGNYDWHQLVGLAERFLGGWSAGGADQREFAALPAEQKLIRREKDIEQLHIVLSYPGFAMADDAVYPMSILNSVLGGSMSSRLFQKIREESGMAYTVYSYPAFYISTGILAIYAGTSLGHAPAVLQMIREEIDALVRDGVPPDEFAKTRAQLKGSYVLGQESASARMNVLGRRMLLQRDTQTEDDVIRKIDAVELNQVNDVIRSVFAGKCAAALVGRGADGLEMAGLEC